MQTVGAVKEKKEKKIKAFSAFLVKIKDKKVRLQTSSAPVSRSLSQSVDCFVSGGFVAATHSRAAWTTGEKHNSTLSPLQLLLSLS